MKAGSSLIFNPDSLPSDRPVLIAGPTASGKSALADRIVETGGGVIVNADALQVYARWRVLTARPSAAEEAALPHRLYGHVEQDQPYSVGHWLREVAAILAEGQRPVIVGGTGLYFTALTEGLVAMPATPARVRAEGDRLLRDEGLAAMIAWLDPATVAKIDLKNPARVQRAWEVLRATGRGLASWQSETDAPLLPLKSVHAIVLAPAPDWLNARIDIRFDAMIAAGALDEVRAALPGWNAGHPYARAIGAAELIAHLRGEMTREAAITAAKIATHQYAKRQRTWFRSRMKAWQSVPLP